MQCFVPERKEIGIYAHVGWEKRNRGNSVRYLPRLHNLYLSQAVPGSFTCKDKALLGIGNTQASPPRTTFAKILRHCAPFLPRFFNIFKGFKKLFACFYFILNRAVYRIARNLGIIAK